MSKCCNADARAHTGDLTGYYTCLKCGRPCDLKSFERGEDRENEKTTEIALEGV